MPTPLMAANTYASLAKLSPGGGVTPGAAGGAGKPAGAGFGDMLQQAMGNLTDAARAADVKVQAGASGKANVVDVVTAVAETEVAISALVSVRDRVIQSYEEIMRMPI
jgi:flagellar hook-basal body complex protein FliE